jgi:hypothetical protein
MPEDCLLNARLSERVDLYFYTVVGKKQPIIKIKRLEEYSRHKNRKISMRGGDPHRNPPWSERFRELRKATGNGAAA